jgi:hypothetical protein
VFDSPIGEHLDALARDEDLPDLALAACTMRIGEAAPALLAVLARAADGEVLDDDETTLLFRGLHVMGAAREQRAFPLLLRLLALPEEELDGLIGDALTETVPQIAAGVFDGDTEALFAAIAGGIEDEYARDTLLRAATFLAWVGRIEPARMQAFLEHLFEVRSAPDEDIVWMSWLQAIILLGLRPLAPLALRAIDEGRVMPGESTAAEFEKELAQAERTPDDITRFTRANLGYIDDPVVALEWTRGWSAEADPWMFDPPSVGGPATNPMRDVGRNDPCPCGSGKKAKKCCLAS